MADGISELWRVGWWPFTPSITQWWTWEAYPWQPVGWAGVQGTNGVDDRAEEGSQLPQYGDWKKKWCVCVGGVYSGLRSEIYGPQLDLLNVFVWVEDGYPDCFSHLMCDLNKQMCITSFSWNICLLGFYSMGLQITSLNPVRFSRHLWKSDPRPV